MLSGEPQWWWGVNAEIYLNEGRFHALLKELGVPLISERVTEISTAKEGSAEGGVVGIVKGATKLGRTDKIITKEPISEAMQIIDLYEKATALKPPRIVRLVEPEDWTILDAHLLVHGAGDFRLVSDPVDELDSNAVHTIEGEIAGRRTSITFSGNHVKSNSGTSSLFSDGEERIMFLGRVVSRPKSAETTEIRPIMIGFPV